MYYAALKLFALLSDNMLSCCWVSSRHMALSLVRQQWTVTYGWKWV